jgi:nucleotide-binding universal stress UspA family protein
VTVLVGLAPNERGLAALQLGAVLARSFGDDLVLATIVPAPWPPDPNRQDAEYLAYLEQAAREVHDRAQAELGNELRLDLVVHRARSVSSGVVEVAREQQASVVTVGSSAAGLLGLVTLGGVGQRVLHTSDIPVAIAPGGYAGHPHGRISRITVAFGRADGDSDLLITAAQTAERIGATLRVVCFAVRPMAVFAGGIEQETENLVVDQWVKGIEADVSRALNSVRAAGTVAVRTDSDLVVGQGTSWSEALAAVAWAEGDLLAVGASSSPVSRFFLGSHASKIVRNSPVPVYVMPRSIPLP